MKVPTISVVIPAHNSADTIRDCLDSVVSQTHQPKEIIIVDDASQDHTVACIEEWQRTSSHELSVICQKENGGPAAARNAGLKAATGEWIAFLDADDAWLPWRLEMQLAMLQQHPDTILLCGQTIGFSDTVTQQYADQANLPSPDVLTLPKMLSHNPVATSTVFVRRDILTELNGFDTAFRGPEDYDLWLRMVAAGKCLYMPIALSKYRTTVGSLSMDDRTFLPEVLRVLDKAFSPNGVLASYRPLRYRAKAQQYASASWMAYNRGDRKRAIILLLHSWLCGPTRLEKEQKDPLQRAKLLIRYVYK